MAHNAAASLDRDEPLELPYESPAVTPLTATEARSYLDGCPSWYQPLAEVLLGAGLRIGEALALEWRDVDQDTSTLRIERAYKRGRVGTPKGDRSRSVAIDSHTLDVLEQHRKASDPRCAIVFPSKRGTHRAAHIVREHGHKGALHDAGLPATFKLHDLRHSAATFWLAAGDAIYFVQAQLGHANLQTTITTYGHADQASFRDTAELAAAWWRTA